MFWWDMKVFTVQKVSASGPTQKRTLEGKSSATTSKATAASAAVPTPLFSRSTRSLWVDPSIVD